MRIEVLLDLKTRLGEGAVVVPENGVHLLDFASGGLERL